MSSLLGTIVARGLASLYELDTVYSLEDAFNLMEIITVGNYNQWWAVTRKK
jgi:hypothetical protein